jgi:hypothetical protein
MAKNTTSEWLPRVLFESFLITMSILVALALDEWREDRQDDEMVQQALSNFVSEIQQNQARIDDAVPFNLGLLNVLRNRYDAKDIGSIDDYVNMVESYAPADLRTTAWETALATGSLAKMDYSLVSNLYFTYSKQNRYQVATRSGMSDLTSLQNLSGDRLDLATYNSIRYLGDITSMEAELTSIYNEALRVIGGAVTSADGDPQ